MESESAEKTFYPHEYCLRKCLLGLIDSFVILFIYCLYLFRLGVERAEIIHISEPIKSHWAKEKGLDLAELLSDGPYKETYRKEMIIWSDSIRQSDPGFFCRASIEQSKGPNN